MATELGVDVIDITLAKFDEKDSMSIRHLVYSVEIWESMDNHTITAYIVIAEGLNLVNEFPIIGEEEVTIEFKTDDAHPVRKYKFFVDSIQAQEADPYNTQNHYKLKCVTRDFVRNSFSLFTRRYMNMTYKDAVISTITDNLKTDKPVNVEDTKGFFDYMVNRVRPFQVLDLIAERAVSAKHQSHVFYFFEDVNGYHFTTMENLIEQRKSKASKKKFISTTDHQTDIRNNNSKQIYHYNITHVGNTVEKIKSGGLRNEVREFDILYGDFWRGWSYNNMEDHGIYSKTDKSYDLNSQRFQKFATEMPAVRNIVVTDGTRKQQSHNDTLSYMIPFKQKVNSLCLKMRVGGDTNITVGDVIQVILPDIKGTTDKRGQQELLSENYIVKELRHVLDNGIDGFSHVMMLDCRKTSFYGSV